MIPTISSPWQRCYSEELHTALCCNTELSWQAYLNLVLSIFPHELLPFSHLAKIRCCLLNCLWITKVVLVVNAQKWIHCRQPPLVHPDRTPLKASIYLKFASRFLPRFTVSHRHPALPTSLLPLKSYSSVDFCSVHEGSFLFLTCILMSEIPRAFSLSSLVLQQFPLLPSADFINMLLILLIPGH